MSAPSDKGPSASEILAAVLAIGAVVVGYAPSFQALVEQWNRDPNYSYGFFVAPIALLILWTRLPRLDRSKLRPSWWGWAFLVVILIMRYPLYEWNEQYLEMAALPWVVLAVGLALGGWHLLQVSWPAVLFLAFMLPLPPSVNTLLARPLQAVATAGSVSALQAMGLPVLAEGNVIIVGDVPLEVARACNGLSMLLSFVTLITAVVLLVPRSWPERLLLLLSAIPIAVLVNVMRITATAMAYRWLGAEVAERYAHDYAGYAMMPVALGLVWLELAIGSRLFVEVQDVDTSSWLPKANGAKSPTRP